MACECEYGTMTVTVNGQIISARGEWTIRPTNFEREGGSNEDGTIWSSRKPMPAEAEGSISACTAGSLEDLFDQCDITVTFEFRGFSYTFPNARVMGRPEINTQDGETSGFKIISPRAILVK